MTSSSSPPPSSPGPDGQPVDAIGAARRELASTGVDVTIGGAAGEEPGDVIDRYTLVERLGEGGMGTVWLAKQREPVVREVALKIIKLGMDTREVVVRFEAERQALALMDHPDIARVLDGGATEGGRPYFVMEVVDGDPITEFCDREGLDLERRLELFARVCEAVQHAHQKGVIHRDLKPSNVLVSMVDGKPGPRIIDFGIAKATSAELTQKTLFTQYSQIIGTPEYMAPEQAELSGLDIDTRADVYSLGVLLYELLTGSKPFDLATALAQGYQALLRTIREDDPPKPSTRVSSLGSTASGLVADPRSGAASLSRRLRGDLDWIVMKALEKDRERRYETASGLAADVGRYLAREPVLAHPQTASYRWRKFVARRKRSVALAAAFLIVLVGGTVGTAIGLVQAREANTALVAAGEAKDRALREEQAALAARDEALSDKERQRIAAVEARDTALQLAEFQHSVILRQLSAPALGIQIRSTLVKQISERSRRSGAGDEEIAGELATLDTLLEGVVVADLAREVVEKGLLRRASRNITAEFADRPAVAAELRRSLAIAYRDIGLNAESEGELRRALELLGTEGDFERRLMFEIDLVEPVSEQGRNDEALALSEQLHATALEQLGATHELTLQIAGKRVFCLLKLARYGEAAQIGLEALADWRTLPEPRSGGPGLLFAFVPNALFELARFEEAEPIILEGIAEAEAGRIEMRAGFPLGWLAHLRERQGRLDEAAELYRRSIAAHRDAFGGTGADVINQLNNLSVVLIAQGQLTEAAESQAAAVADARVVLGSEHPNTGVYVHTLGEIHLAKRSWDDAERALREAHSIYEAAGFHRHLGLLLTQLALVHTARGEFEESLELLEAARPHGVDPMTLTDAAFEPLHRDPRFEAATAR